MEKGIVITGALISVVVGVILRGFVLSQLWVMFMVPMGLPPIGIATGLGISLVVQMLVSESSSSSDKSDESLGLLSLRVIATPLIFWVFGGLIHLFM